MQAHFFVSKFLLCLNICFVPVNITIIQFSPCKIKVLKKSTQKQKKFCLAPLLTARPKKGVMWQTEMMSSHATLAANGRLTRGRLFLIENKTQKFSLVPLLPLGHSKICDIVPFLFYMYYY